MITIREDLVNTTSEEKYYVQNPKYKTGNYHHESDVRWALMIMLILGFILGFFIHSTFFATVASSAEPQSAVMEFTSAEVLP